MSASCSKGATHLSYLARCRKMVFQTISPQTSSNSKNSRRGLIHQYIIALKLWGEQLMPSKFYNYSVIVEGENKNASFNVVQTSSKIEACRIFIDKINAGDDLSIDEENNEEPPEDLSDIGKGIWHFLNQIKTYYELAEVSSIFPKAFPASFFKSQILSYAEKNIDAVEEYNGHKIYALDEYHNSELKERVSRWNEIESAFSKLPSSIILSLVSTFDSAFSDFTKVLLKSRPQRYSGSDKQYSVSQLYQ